MSGILDGLKLKAASTDPAAEDPRMRGRTYAIPFDAVWRAALAIGDGGMPGWTTVRKNDQLGVLELLVQPGIGPASKHVDVRVEIGLDEHAQTRVDMTAVSRTGHGDLGRSGRLVRRYLARLDEKLEAGPDSILDPASLHAYVSRFRASPPPAQSEDRPGEDDGERPESSGEDPTARASTP